MSKRFVVVGGATAVAGLVLGASIVFGPPSAKPSKANLPNNIEAPGVGAPTDNPDAVDVTIQRFDYTTFELDSDGQLRGMRLRAERTNLKPQGITELIKPYAEVRLGSQRAITIRADKADMEMEDGKPRSGLFTGNVVVTLAEAPVGTVLILEDPDADEDADQPQTHEQFVQQRIYMDEAADPQKSGVNFSIEDDTISTQGPVHVTSPQVDFFGIGLQLAYNTQRERIEQLIISEGRDPIINPDADAPGFDAKAQTNADAQQAGEASGTDAQPAAPKQFYAATFQDNILVRDGVESELAGQTLTIDFSLGTDAVEVKPITPDTAGRLPGVIPIGQLAQASFREGEAPAEPLATDDSRLGGSLALPVLVIPKQNQSRTMLTHKPERDIVVTWTGRLTVEPHANRPESLTSDEDALLTLEGPNAYAQTNKNGEVERLETSKLEYLLSAEQTTAYARDDKALRILSTALGGEITGTQLVVRQTEGTATIVGPGELTYTDKKEGKTLNLTWENRLDLELYTQQTDAEAETNDAPDNRGSTRILGVKTATFDGGVTAKHTDFDLEAQTLTLVFAKPDKANDIENTPTAINASGDVAVQARGDAADETFDITAGRLSIELKLDDNKEPYASAIYATGNISVDRPGSKLTCKQVSVELNPPKDETTNADAEPSEASGTDAATQDRFAEVRSILAVGNVVADLEDEDGRRINLLADQLVADVEKDKLTLAANNRNSPAEVTDLTTGRKLTGMLVEMDDQAEILNITGKGSLATVLDDPNNPNAGIEDAFLAIDWTKSMSFNNITGEAEFHENVRTESRRSIDSSELTCDHLKMLFSPELVVDANPVAEAPIVEGEEEVTRDIRSAVATGNVKFLASAWDVDEPTKINNRLRLEGPKLIITNQPAEDGKPANETLIVKGKGRMVLEDYRPPDEQDAGNEAKLTGRGATLFSWEQAMTLDALANTATLIDTVQMVHLPKDEAGKTGDAVQLDCNKLVADMTDTGGMAVWLNDNAPGNEPDAQIQSIIATENVRLLQQGTRSMRGDTLTFDGEKNLVTLTADDNRDVILQDLERDTSTRTNKVMWDLIKDRIEIEELRGGVAPLN